MNIVIFGDSITWGAYDPDQGGWTTRLRNYFEAKDNEINLYNLGIPGDTTADLLTRIENEARSREPKVIIIAIGINDARFIHSTNSLRVSPEEFEQNISKLNAISQKFTQKVVFVGLTVVDESKTAPIPGGMDMSYRNKDIMRLDNVIKEFCKVNKLKFITMEGLIGDGDLVDGLHPNTRGHIKIFNQIRIEIESML